MVNGTSCDQKPKKDIEVFKEDIKESNADLQQKAKQTSEQIKTIITEDWEIFKSAAEKTIQTTEDELKKLRWEIAKTTEEKEKLIQELDHLKEKNKVLKIAYFTPSAYKVKNELDITD